MSIVTPSYDSCRREIWSGVPTGRVCDPGREGDVARVVRLPGVDSGGTRRGPWTEPRARGGTPVAPGTSAATQKIGPVP